GLFFIRMMEIRGGYTCLWTDLSLNGYAGFIRRRTNQGPYSANLWCEARLNDDKWQFVVED
ncbi:MAG TPA: hypothetical protein VND64_26355, partial [Pirellulales bacterium]|nr:hypothetical protein [Pirellulales bacterium]